MSRSPYPSPPNISAPTKSMPARSTPTSPSTRLSPKPSISPAAAPWARSPSASAGSRARDSSTRPQPRRRASSTPAPWRIGLPQRRRSRRVGPGKRLHRDFGLLQCWRRREFGLPKLRQPAVGLGEPRQYRLRFLQHEHAGPRDPALISGFGNHGARLSGILNNGSGP